MSFRVSALVAVVVVVEAAAFTPVLAQPQAPVRPRYTQFQNIFRPGQVPLANPGQGMFNQPGAGFVNPGGPQVPGFAYPGQLSFPQGRPGTYGIDPQLPPTGVVGTFNNLGPWYGGNTGNYGHWYPNGIGNGRGVAGFAGGGGGGAVIGGNFGPTVGGGMLRGGSIGGTALGVGAAVGAFRR